MSPAKPERSHGTGDAAPLRLLRGANVHAPEPLGSTDLLIAGSRIGWLGAAGTLEPPPGAEVEDLDGRIVVPGFVDPHVHITGGGGESGPESRIDPLPVSEYWLAGVTTVVGLLGTDDVTRGPRDLLATVNKLRALGLDAHAWIGGYHLPPRSILESAQADLAFFDPFLGIGEVAISDHRSSQPTLERLLDAASQAHVGGMLGRKAGLLHLHLGDGPSGLALVRDALQRSEIPVRVFYPTHLNRRTALFHEGLDLSRAGGWIDLTAYPEERGAPPADATTLDAADALQIYLDSGLDPERVTVSSDAGGSLPVFDSGGNLVGLDTGRPACLFDSFRRFRTSTDASFEQALLPFTRNVARHLRLAGRGVVAAGGLANLVGLDEEGTVSEVMCGGHWRVRAGQLFPR